ncbi:T9SS type A sorting domain-containing protein [Hymenobacter sp. BT18]|uniref:T9SS type A sorting domain-containing protein n=1 Tax=Hymenobacter sp. BT18 TaxID=2835648 RepID=UPI00143EDD16|nr:T9SS type A sorting domain-containing protein [Hymenobacter sp. BT18]QIX61225.1 T9SS type A sorting domain-containing protein [Hymenobacter sp. BT18]
MKKTLPTNGRTGLSHYAWRSLLGLSLVTTLGLAPAAGAASTPGSAAASRTLAETDLLVDSDMTLSYAGAPDGAYAFHNVTVTNGARLTVEWGVTVAVSGKMTVEAGSSLECQGLVYGPGSFVLADGAQLAIYGTEGIAAEGQNSGVIQTATRSFSDLASYVYAVPPVFVVDSPPVTGSGLPDQVEFLVIGPDLSSSARQQKPNDSFFALLLSKDVKVRSALGLFSADLYLNEHTLTLLSTEKQTAEVALLDLFEGFTGEVIGSTAVMQKYLSAPTAIGYHHLSSPVRQAPFSSLNTGGNFKGIFNATYNSAAKPAAVTPFPNVFGYDDSRRSTPNESYGQGFSRGWFSPTGGNMEDGRGYSVNISRGQTLKFSGELNGGDVGPIELISGDQEDGGWNLLGNPYPSTIDWSLAVPNEVIPPGMDASAYIFTPTSRYGGTYRTYFNNGDGTEFGDPSIAPGQGFFTRLLNQNDSRELTFTDALRSFSAGLGTTELRAGQPFGYKSVVKKKAAPTVPYVQLELKSAGGAQDAAYVYFQPNATATVENRYDAPKLRNLGEASLFTLVGTQELAVNGQAPLAGSAISIPVGLSAAAGTYTIQAGQLLNFASGQSVELIDNATGSTIDLRQQPAYTFTLDKAFSGQRFNLRFGANSVTGNHDAVKSAQVALYPNPARTSFELHIPVVAGGKTVKASLYNSLGQRVQTKLIPMTANGAAASFDVQQLARGVYSLQLEIGASRLTKRVVVE